MRGLVLLLLQGGLIFGILGLGLFQICAMTVGTLIVVFPIMPSQGKSNLFRVFTWKLVVLKSCIGALGSSLEEYLAQRRANLEAAAEARAAEVLAAEDAESSKTKKQRTATDMSQGGPDAKKMSSPKKVGGPKPKKKKA